MPVFVNRRRFGSLFAASSVVRSWGDPEVDDLHDLLAVLGLLQEDVVRLHVAVDDAATVSCRQGTTDLQGDVQASHRLDDVDLGELVREVVPLEELHRQKRRAGVELAEVEDVEHVRVLDAGGADRFLLEARHDVLLLRVLGAEDLERDLLLDGLVLGKVDLAHPAFPELLEDAVAAGNDLAEQRVYFFGLFSHVSE